MRVQVTVLGARSRGPLLAVYASQSPSPATTQDSRLVTNLCRPGLPNRWAAKQVSCSSASLPLLPGLARRNAPTVILQLQKKLGPALSLPGLDCILLECCISYCQRVIVSSRLEHALRTRSAQHAKRNA